MAKTTAQRAAEHRARQQEKLARLARAERALAAILARLDGKTGPVAVEIGKLARDGLGVEEGK